MEFDYYWIYNFSNCTSSIDGKHIVMQDPMRSNSSYFNHKERYSVVLIAVCDSHYRTTLVNIGKMVQYLLMAILGLHLKKKHSVYPNQLSHPTQELIFLTFLLETRRFWCNHMKKKCSMVPSVFRELEELSIDMSLKYVLYDFLFYENVYLINETRYISGPKEEEMGGCQNLQENF